MNKLLEVKEFDLIIGNKDYINDSNYKYMEHSAFNKLIEFIHTFNNGDDSSDVLQFMKIKYKRNIGDVVLAQHYVGLIQMDNGYQVQILPKISLDEDDEFNEKTKKIFMKMLRSMKDFPAKVFNDASLKVSKMNLYEIFINMYLQNVRLLIKHGIKSGYISKEDNLRFYKGKLMVSEHIKRNLGHKERFFVSFDEFQVNRVENRIVKSTLLKLMKLSSSAENMKEIRQMLTSFDMVSPSTNYQKDFSKVVINRNTKDYEMLMKWSKVFLMNKSFANFSGETTSRALLFPMEKVFEVYVAKYVKKVFGEEGWNISAQDRGYYLFNSPRKQFALIPDIVARNGDKTVIMDTKWKSLYDNERINYGISQSDMYQMYAYAKKYNTSEIWLLYPLNDEMKGHVPITFKSDDNVNVHLFFVDVANIEDSLGVLKEMVNSSFMVRTSIGGIS